MFTENKVNSISFTPDEIKNNLHLDFLNFLFKYNEKAENSFFDIHITTDGLCMIVEFARVDYRDSNYEGFVYLDDEHQLLRQITFPDNHYEYFPDNEVEEVLNNWLKDHPEWELDQFGNWCSKNNK